MEFYGWNPFPVEKRVSLKKQNSKRSSSAPRQNHPFIATFSFSTRQRDSNFPPSKNSAEQFFGKFLKDQSTQGSLRRNIHQNHPFILRDSTIEFKLCSTKEFKLPQSLRILRNNVRKFSKNQRTQGSPCRNIRQKQPFIVDSSATRRQSSNFTRLGRRRATPLNSRRLAQPLYD